MNDSLKDATALVQKNLSKGITCPCCGQFARRYKRKLNSSMAHDLVLAYRLHRTEWFRWRDMFKREGGKSNEFAKLRFWGLLERLPFDPKYKRKGSWWRITQAGVEFVERTRFVPRHVWIYNDKLYRSSTEMTGIEAALGDHFDYGELMKG